MEVNLPKNFIHFIEMTISAYNQDNFNFFQPQCYVEAGH